jgi:hypothetical protein
LENGNNDIPLFDINGKKLTGSLTLFHVQPDVVHIQPAVIRPLSSPALYFYKYFSGSSPGKRLSALP